MGLLAVYTILLLCPRFLSNPFVLSGMSLNSKKMVVVTISILLHASSNEESIVQIVCAILVYIFSLLNMTTSPSRSIPRKRVGQSCVLKKARKRHG